MSIKMPSKKFPQISVSQETYIAMENLKYEMKVRSFNDLLGDLIKEHRQKQEVPSQ